MIVSSYSEVIMHFKTIFRSLKNKDMLKRVLIILGIIAALFIIFTFFPPDIPLFEDSTSGSYGIITGRFYSPRNLIC